jgi:hypothetical protein
MFQAGLGRYCTSTTSATGCVDYPTIPLSCYPQIPTLFLVLFLKYHVPARKMARSVPQLFAKGIYGNLMKLYLFVQWKKHWLNHLQRKN